MKTIGGYALAEKLGRGATAEVFLARASDPEALPVALKVFHPGFWGSEHARDRARMEFRAASTLDHPNIVRVFEPLFDADPPAVVLEYIDGWALDSFQSRLPYVLPEISVLIVIEVLKALEHAHERGIIHRDLKPANIMIEKSGRVVVSDFGLARILDASKLTATGTVLGSPDFMSPEQAKGDPADARSDLFSLASVLYFLLTGTRPFSRGNPLATLSAVAESRPEQVQRRNPKISAPLARLVHQGLSKDPADRFACAADMRRAFEDYLIGIGFDLEQMSFANWVNHSNELTFAALQSISESLIRRCESELGNAQWDCALGTLSHLSAVAPESDAIVRLSREIGRRKRRLRNRWILASGASAALLIAGVGVALTRIPTEKPEAADRKTALAQPTDATPAAASAATAPVAAPVASAPRAETDRVSTSRAAPVRRLGQVTLDVPNDVRVFWDGRRMESNESFQTEIGRHQLRMEKPGARPIVQTIRVSADEPTVIRAR